MVERYEVYLGDLILYRYIILLCNLDKDNESSKLRSNVNGNMVCERSSPTLLTEYTYIHTHIYRNKILQNHVVHHFHGVIATTLLELS